MGRNAEPARRFGALAAARDDRLFARYLPRLHRWAHGRVPTWARDGANTADFVQETVLHTRGDTERRAISGTWPAGSPGVFRESHVIP